jgi:flavin reductase (DIM6/NTAB) family NADH-FMN oxidoreductase RutF
MHTTTNPAILYFGTPVVLISTVNEDGSFNLAPMSSAWWLGWRCLLGLGARSKTPQNMARTGECALNLPSTDLVGAVDRLARTTGSDPVPKGKVRRGYRHVKDKFTHAGLTPIRSETVQSPRVEECAVQLEATVRSIHPVADDDPATRGALVAIEVAVQRVHVEESLLVPGEPERIDPDCWRPLIMSFQRFYGLAGGEIHPSELAKIPEALYR